MKVIFNNVEEGSKHAWFKLSEVEGLESGAFETHSVLDLSDDWVLAQEVHHPKRSPRVSANSIDGSDMSEEP